MRHRVYGRHLGRNKNQRTALFRSLVQSLFLSGTIETTESKAKAIKGLVDKLVNQAKSPTTQRLVSQFITSKKVSEKLIKDIVPSLSQRVSGYTSVVKLGRRLGDNSMVVRMSLLMSPPVILSETKDLDVKVMKDEKLEKEKSTEEKVEAVKGKKADSKKTKSETK